MTSVYILETEHLLFRRLVMDDLDALFALYSDSEIRQFFPEGTLNYEETKEELEWFLSGHPNHPEYGLWATIYKENQQFIGRCGLLPWTIEERDEVEVAYLLDKKYWRRGLGTEAAQGILNYAFNELKLSRLVCMIEPDNVASQKVATKIGMKLEKTAKDDKGEFLLFSIEKSSA